MVRLQKRFAYKYKEKEHYKHVVTIPEDAVDRLGWKAGEEITQVVQGKKLILMSTNSHRRQGSEREDVT